jgi:hypothetical protein
VFCAAWLDGVSPYQCRGDLKTVSDQPVETALAGETLRDFAHKAQSATATSAPKQSIMTSRGEAVRVGTKD